MYEFEFYFAKKHQTLLDGETNKDEFADLSKKVLPGAAVLSNKWLHVSKENAVPGYVYYFSSTVKHSDKPNVWKDSKSLLKVEVPHGPYNYNRFAKIEDYLQGLDKDLKPQPHFSSGDVIQFQYKLA